METPERPRGLSRIPQLIRNAVGLGNVDSLGPRAFPLPPCFLPQLLQRLDANEFMLISVTALSFPN
jgi:hypothetical protein